MLFLILGTPYLHLLLTLSKSTSIKRIAEGLLLTKLLLINGVATIKKQKRLFQVRIGVILMTSSGLPKQPSWMTILESIRSCVRLEKTKTKLTNILIEVGHYSRHSEMKPSFKIHLRI